RGPGMDLEHARLDEGDQALLVLDVHVLLARAVALDDGDPMRARERLLPVLLEEARLAEAVRTAEQRQRPPRDARQDAVGDLDVVGGERLLRDALLRVEDAVGMSEPDAGERRAVELEPSGARDGA